MAARLSPFSFVILVLVGRGGAGPHDLRRMAERGRVYWDAAPSQWYAEPKRLEKLGLLSSRKEPGRTRARTHYELTDAGIGALAEWVRTPAAMPRIQQEAIARVLAADLVDHQAILEGLEPLGAELADAAAAIEDALDVATTLPERRHLLEINHRYAARLIELQREWLREAQAALA
jgi:DNA-binding PadR family transcriptional regulator